MAPNTLRVVSFFFLVPRSQAYSPAITEDGSGAVMYVSSFLGFARWLESERLVARQTCNQNLSSLKSNFPCPLC